MLRIAPQIAHIELRDTYISDPSRLQELPSGAKFPGITLTKLRTLTVLFDIANYEDSTDHAVGEEFLSALLQSCPASVLEALELPLNADVFTRWDSIPPTLFAGLTTLAIQLDTDHDFDLHGAAKRVITCLERCVRLDSFSLTACGSDYFVLDYVLQCFILSAGPVPPEYHDFSPRLRSLYLRGGQLRWPKMLYMIYKQRNASISKDRGLFRVELDQVGRSSGDIDLPPWTVVFRDHDSEEFRRFSQEAGLEEGPGVMESLFEIESPQERLDLLCTITGEKITSPWEETDMTGGQPVGTPNDA